jgi:hypothetical protein
LNNGIRYCRGRSHPAWVCSKCRILWPALIEANIKLHACFALKDRPDFLNQCLKLLLLTASHLQLALCAISQKKGLAAVLYLCRLSGVIRM